MYLSCQLLLLWLASFGAARFMVKRDDVPLFPEHDPQQYITVVDITQDADGTVPLFPYEQHYLTEESLQALKQILQEHHVSSEIEQICELFDFSSTDVTQTQGQVNYDFAGPGNCKLFPGDAKYPNSIEWEALNLMTGGALMKPRPQASACYDDMGDFNNASCTALTNEWTDPFFQQENPIEPMTPLYEGMTCQPPSIFNTGGCTQGGYPVYVVKVTNVAQIQVALNFARNTGIRLVIRNTGHDFSTKSSGAGALSTWVHNLKDIGYIAEYKDSNYSGPAFKFAAGIADYEAYYAASQKGLMVTGGECPTVGIAGGYIQGGGHSPLGPMFGMAVDEALGFEVVTADGRFVTANRDTNPDLFWALRGGGGSTYGIVTSVIVRAHYDMTITTASWSYATTGDGAISPALFNAATKAFFEFFPQGADAKTYSYFKIFPGSFDMQPFFAPNKTLAETKALLGPYFDKVRAMGLNITPNITQFNGFLDAYNQSFPTEAVINQGVVTASRLFTRQNWANETIFNATYDSFQSNLDNGLALICYNMNPSLAAGDYQDTALHPAWRDTLGFMITGVVTNMSAPASVQLEVHRNFTYGPMQVWRDLTPGSGAYLNEADRIEPDFQWAFWGPNYPRLLELKKRYDPFNVFFATTAVGSEFFEVRSVNGLPTENGKLCRNPSPSMFVDQGPVP